MHNPRLQASRVKGNVKHPNTEDIYAHLLGQIQGVDSDNYRWQPLAGGQIKSIGAAREANIFQYSPQKIFRGVRCRALTL